MGAERFSDLFKATQQVRDAVGTGTHIRLALKPVFTPGASLPHFGFPHRGWEARAYGPEGW